MSTEHELPKQSPEKNEETTNQNQYKVLKEFLENLFVPFPELKNTLHQGCIHLLNSDFETEEVEQVINHCKTAFPPHFFNILYKNDEMFEESCELIPNIDFSLLYKENISDATRDVLWKYLQLLLFSFVGDSTTDSFGDASKFFEQLDGEDFKSKLEETFKEMENLFSNSGVGESASEEASENTEGFMPKTNINLEDLPDVEEMHSHISGLLDGKLGKLAKEIAEETAGELNIEDSENVEGAFKNLIGNPGKLMNLVKNIGSKMDEKLKSGDINQEELFKEANDLMGKMNTMPGMDNMQEMFSKMGMGGLFSKRNMNQAMSKMNQTMGQQTTKNRLRRKLEERKAAAAAATATTATTESSNHLEKKETKWRPDESEPIQKTMKSVVNGEEATKKKKRKKKKKPKN